MVKRGDKDREDGVGVGHVGDGVGHGGEDGWVCQWNRESSITRAINGISGIEKVPLTVALVSSFLIGKFGGGGDTLVAMTKKKTPQILKTDTALKLAEKWVANMSMPAEDDPIEAQQEARPPRKLEANMSLQRLQTECRLIYELLLCLTFLRSQIESFGAKDEISCLFQCSLDNLGSLKQQYGLAKNANEVLLVIEAYKTLRDRAPYPANHVVSHLSGDFAFVVFDKSTSTLFVASVNSF
ncbi:hypothetical protein HID58_067081 [Brassica napus]|uniref:DUF3700 domain-containing protein n=1 Tax=Brassica napus TaxID=3708 RepID=A0ABQ7ZHI4_BRANA|nr:hypothetical protein HID58_067081 [Brassica napus]